MLRLWRLLDAALAVAAVGAASPAVRVRRRLAPIDSGPTVVHAEAARAARQPPTTP